MSAPETPPAEVDAAARARCEAGDHAGATTLAIQTYGEELYSFLLVRCPSEDDAADIFAQACEDLMGSLATFEWRCSLRTWCYRLVRSAAARYHRAPAQQAARRVPLSQVSEIADQIRSRTLAHRRSEVKDQMRALREQLEPDEQMLLVLRVDRGLSWKEIAQIVEDDDAAARLDAAAARLRQQFQKLKARLRSLAVARGVIEPE